MPFFFVIRSAAEHDKEGRECDGDLVPWTGNVIQRSQGGGDAAEDLAGQPVEAGLFLDAPDAQAHGVLADGSRHAEQAGVDAIATHTVDVGVAPVAAQDAQQRRAHDVAGTAATVAGVV